MSYSLKTTLGVFLRTYYMVPAPDPYHVCGVGRILSGYDTAGLSADLRLHVEGRAYPTIYG